MLRILQSYTNNVMEGLSAGADDYLSKPFHPSEFLLRIHNLLERQRKLRDKFRSDFSTPEIRQPVKIETSKEQAAIQDPLIEKLYQFIEDYFDDLLFSVDQLVELSGISRTSLHRKLKTVTDFIRLYRLKQATVFLSRDSTAPILPTKVVLAAWPILQMFSRNVWHNAGRVCAKYKMIPLNIIGKKLKKIII